MFIILHLLKASKQQHILERLPLKTNFALNIIYIFILYFLNSHWLQSISTSLFLLLYFVPLHLTSSDCQINILFCFPLIWEIHTLLLASKILLSAGSPLAVFDYSVPFFFFLSINVILSQFLASVFTPHLCSLYMFSLNDVTNSSGFSPKPNGLPLIFITSFTTKFSPATWESSPVYSIYISN